MARRDARFPLRSAAALLAVLLLAAACEPAGAPDAGGTSESEGVVTDYIDAYNDRDLDRLTRIVAPTVVYGEEETDRQELLAAIEGFWAAFPDVELEPTHLVSDGEWTAIRIEFTGTHEGEFAGIEPTGEPATGSEIMLFRVRDGEITDYVYEWDELGFFEQLGAVERTME